MAAVIVFQGRLENFLDGFACSFVRQRDLRALNRYRQ